MDNYKNDSLRKVLVGSFAVKVLDKILVLVDRRTKSIQVSLNLLFILFCSLVASDNNRNRSICIAIEFTNEKVPTPMCIKAIASRGLVE